MQGKQLQITAHLFQIEKPDSDSSYQVFSIRNSSRKKIKNRARLRRKYLKNFQILVEQFDENSASQMDIHYLAHYVYHFQKVEGNYIEVFKRPQDHQTRIPWARYTVGKVEFSETNYEGRYEYCTLFGETDDNDPYEEVKEEKEEKYCVICNKKITCPGDAQDLHSWQYNAVIERQELKLKLLEIPPLCLQCVQVIKKYQEVFIDTHQVRFFLDLYKAT